MRRLTDRGASRSLGGMDLFPRRQFLKSTVALAALSHPLAALAQSAGNSPLATKPGQKKGLAGGHGNPQWAKIVSNLKVHWTYNWSLNRPADVPPGVDWVPMIHKVNANISIEKSIEKARADLPQKPIALLGFNEPDQEKQANMTVEAALEAWPKLQELNLPLGSPSGVHADSPWMQSFMAEATKRKYRIDFITVHWYGGPRASELMTHLEKVARLYKLPLWITEFCPADWSAGKTGKNQHSEKDVLAFLKDALPRLERTNYLQRYAWYTSAPGNSPTGCSALFDAEGNLTKIGEAYASIG